MPNIKKLSDLTDLEGKRVLVTGSIDVPLDGDVIKEDFRLARIKPTIEYLKNKKAKVILIGHIGHDVAKSTAPIAEYFGLQYVDSLDQKIVNEKVSVLKNGEGVVLKNVRTDDREEKNDEAFARELALCADIYVNEDFPTSHRNYVSIIGLTKFLPSYAGLEFMEELENLSGALTPAHPFVCIFGGAKADTKIPLVHKFADKADILFVGGSLANTIFRAKGFETGVSLVDGSLEEAKKVSEYNNVMLPVDSVVESSGKPITKNPSGLDKEDNIMDIGLDTVQMLGAEIAKAKCVLWNGPLGIYEKGYKEGTESVAKILADSRAKTIIGGGDTITSIKKLGLLDKFTFVSIAGGAMIDFLVDGTLPAIEALKNSLK